MRELNEQELEQVAGGFNYSNYGQANAGSEASIKVGVYGSKSTATVISGYGATSASAGNTAFAIGYKVSVSSGASSSASQVIGY